MNRLELIMIELSPVISDSIKERFPDLDRFSLYTDTMEDSDGNIILEINILNLGDSIQVKIDSSTGVAKIIKGDTLISNSVKYKIEDLLSYK